MATILGSLLLKITGDTKSLDASLSSTEKKAIQLSKNLKKVGNDIAKVGKNLSMFVTLPLAAIGAVAVKNAADFEKQQVAFETMLGSADKARKLLKDIEAFSATTPFQLPGLLVASKRLLAFGTKADDIIETMTRLGNAAQGDQNILDRLTLAFGKLQAKGRATMEELNMFTEAGVPIIQALADNYGVATSELFKMIETGQVGFEDVNDALTNLTTGAGQFAGMIEKQSQTLAGLFSTLKDNLGLLLKDLADVFLPILKEIISKAIEFAKCLREMDDSQRKLIVTILGIAAAIGPTIFIIGKLISAFATLKIAIIAVNATMLATPWGLFVTAVAGLSLAIWGLTTSYREEKKFEREILALKKTLSLAREEEKVKIQEVIVAKLRDAYVTAEAHAMEMEQMAERDRAAGRHNLEYVKERRLVEKSREKAEELRKEFAKENAELVRLVELYNAYAIANQKIIIQLPQIKDDIEKIVDVIENDLIPTTDSATLHMLGVGDAVLKYLDGIKINIDDTKGEYADLIDKIQEYTDAATMVLTGVGDVFSQFYTNRDIELENDYEKRKQAIKNNIEDEEERADALEGLDKEFDEKRKELKTKQARTDKAQGILTATIETFVAANKALAQGGIFGGPGFAAIMIALGMAKVAAIAAQKIPKFAIGGDFIVPPGYPHDSYPIAVESGERVQVTSKKQVGQGSGGGPTSGDVYLDGDKVGRWIEQQTRNRQLKIDSGALV